MIVSKDIDTIIWRFIHSSIMKSLNIEYSRNVHLRCDEYKYSVCANVCSHATYFCDHEYNWRFTRFQVYSIINNYKRGRLEVGRLPDNY